MNAYKTTIYPLSVFEAFASEFNLSHNYFFKLFNLSISAAISAPALARALMAASISLLHFDNEDINDAVSMRAIIAPPFSGSVLGFTFTAAISSIPVFIFFPLKNYPTAQP